MEIRTALVLLVTCSASTTAKMLRAGRLVPLASATLSSPIAPVLATATTDSAKDALLLLDGRLTQTAISPTLTLTVLIFASVWLYFALFERASKL